MEYACKLLLEHINKNQSMTDYNKCGEILVDGIEICGSNISDLLKCCMHNYKNFHPTGERQLCKLWQK